MDLKTRIKRLATFTPPETSAATNRSDESDLGGEIPPLSLYIPSAKDYEYKDLIHEKLLRILDLSLLTNMESEEAHKSIRDAISRIMAETSMALNAGARSQLVKLIEDEVLGLGPMEPLLAEPSVADILVNGAHAIYVERFGRLELTPLRFKDDDHLMKIIDRIVSGIGRRIDESSPMVDARLKDGSRVNAVIPPLALDGPMLSIRRFMTDRLQLDELVATESMNAVIAEVLKAAVKGRLNILISGGTGSGKTTLLNAMSNHIPEEERVVTIEDSAELQLQQAHVIRLETRPANIEGKGEVTQRELVRNSLRMRPDRIVLGEVRGEEAFDMLQAMNTGHDGSLTTIHSNAPRDAIARLENMISMTGFDLPVKAMRSQIASAIDMVIQLERMEDGRRRLISVHEIEGMEADVVTMAEIFRYDREGLDENGQVLGYYTATGVVPTFSERLRKRGIMLNTDYFNPDYTGDPRHSDYTLVES
jgi:pilus assembly protein CpaF